MPSSNTPITDPDARVLAQMIEQGADLRKPHMPEFVFEADKEDRADAIADELFALGFKVELYEPESDSPAFQIVAKRKMLLELKALNKLTEQFDALAEKHGAVYDGWGAEIVE